VRRWVGIPGGEEEADGHGDSEAGAAARGAGGVNNPALNPQAFNYSTGVVRVTSRLLLGVIASMGALALLYATAWLFSLGGVTVQFLDAPTPLGIALSLAVVGLGALNLPLDFAFIRRAAAAGAPKYMAWYGAFGLMLSLIWIYVSVLRLLALVRRAQG
jgi:uncharacterized YccA/Bax inhibitor family protein